MSSTPALESDSLGKRFGRTWALRECTLAIPRGQVTALVGPNGAGKTTLLHLAVGRHGFEDSSVQADGMTACPQRQPVEIDASGRCT
jgi:ABC-2 type transport system ATP-binding protein